MAAIMSHPDGSVVIIVRFVHTSDWHLGKRLCEASLLEDQAYALVQIFEICRSERADALVVAGDLYDRAVPPLEAVALLSDFFQRVIRDLRIPVIAISGNHDSPDRLGFGAELLAEGRLHLRTSFERRALPVVVEPDGRSGGRSKARPPTHFYCLPYLEPEAARAALGDPEIADHDRAVRAALAAMHQDRAARRADQAILVAHLFAAGGVESQESERALVVGGAARVEAPSLLGWSYAALGHLHAPQPVGGREAIRYSGSPLKYSFGESEQEKGVAVVELVLGRAAVRTIPLTPRRDLVRIEGRFQELVSDPRFAPAELAYVEATYTDTGYVVDAAARLRQRFPNLLLALPRQLLRQLDAERPAAGVRAEAGPRELLLSFWKHVEGDDPADYVVAFEAALARVEKQGRQECALAS
jgi:DNA repair protein SbcD/Mre11